MKDERAQTTPPFDARGNSIPFQVLCTTTLICIGTALSLALWSIPNWGIFAQNFRSFPVLWQVVANRPVLIILTIKVFSPVLVTVLLCSLHYLWSTWTSAFSRPASNGHRPSYPTAQSPSPNNLPGRAAEQAPLIGLPDRASWVHPSTASLPPTGYDPVTPLPPILLSSEDDAPSERTSASGGPATNGETISPLQDTTPSTDRQTTHHPYALSWPYGDRLYMIEITLLKVPTLTVCTRSGIRQEVPLNPSAKRVLLLAYLACLRGKHTDRVRMLERVFGHGKDDDDASQTRLSEMLDSHKKLLRRDVREAVRQINAEVGEEAVPHSIDVFQFNPQEYRLSDVCVVTDLEEVEKCYKVIERAHKTGRTATEIPVDVKEACDLLLAAYTGDFLEQIVTSYLFVLEPWASSWVRQPYTYYRDLYLQALLDVGEYEWHQAQQFADDHPGVEGDLRRKEQAVHYALAAQAYRTYALAACKNRFDTKVSFGVTNEPDGRVSMSERALRRCMVAYGAIGKTAEIDTTYAEYRKQMRRVSSNAWAPSKETLEDLREAKGRTSAYRFAALAPHRPETETHLEPSV